MRALLEHLPAAQRPRGRLALQLHLAARRATSRGARTSSRVDWQIARARGSAPATSTTRTRTFSPTARPPPPSTSRSPNVVRKNGPGRRCSLTADPHLQPEPDQRVHLRRGPGRRLHRAGGRPVDAREPAGVEHAAALRRAPIPTASCRAWRFRRHRQPGVRHQPPTGHRLQRHALRPEVHHQQLHENLTKMVGRTPFKGGLYYQRATNRRTSFGPVQANLVFGATPPAEHRPPVRQRAPRASSTPTPRPSRRSRATTSTRTSRATFRTPGRSRRTSRSTTACGSRTTSRSTTRRTGSGSSTPISSIRRRPCASTGRCACGLALRRARRSTRRSAARPRSPTPGPPTTSARSCPSSGDLTNGIGRAADGYPAGGFDTAPVLWGPRLGFAWDVRGDRQDGRPRRLRHHLRPHRHRPRRRRDHQPARHPGGDAQQRHPQLARGRRAERHHPRQRRRRRLARGRQGADGLQLQHRRAAEIWAGASCVDIAYVGTQSRHNPRQTDLNAIPYGAMFLRENQDPTRYERRRARRGARPAAGATATPACPSAARRRSTSTCCGPTPATAAMRFAAFDSKASLQLAAGGAAAALLAELQLRRLVHAVAGQDRLGRRRRRDLALRPRPPTTTRSPTSTAPTTSWRTTSGTCPGQQAPRRRPARARRSSTTGRCRASPGSPRGNPAELGLSIAGHQR